MNRRVIAPKARCPSLILSRGRDTLESRGSREQRAEAKSKKKIEREREREGGREGEKVDDTGQATGKLREERIPVNQGMLAKKGQRK